MVDAEAPLVLAVPSKGRLKEQVDGWLAGCGFALEASGGERGYRAALRGLPGAEVRLMSAGDIAAALDAGDIHLGVTGEDLLRETGEGLDGRVMLLRALGFGRADLVVAAPQGWIDVETMADVGGGGAPLPGAHGLAPARGHQVRCADPRLLRRPTASPTTASSTAAGPPRARRRRVWRSWWWTSPPPARRSPPTA